MICTEKTLTLNKPFLAQGFNCVRQQHLVAHYQQSNDKLIDSSQPHQVIIERPIQEQKTQSQIPTFVWLQLALICIIPIFALKFWTTPSDFK